MPKSDALTRLAKAFFVVNIDRFLDMPPEQVQKLCAVAGIDEAEFVSACQTLIRLGQSGAQKALLH